MEGDRAGVQGDRRVNVTAAPLRILLSREACESLASPIAQVLGGRAHVLLPPAPGVDADIACVTRDVTGLSTKHQLEPHTRAFYDALEGAPSLRWVHVHSAGTDRPAYVRLRERGVQLTTSSGSNAMVVAHSALAGLLALARHLPRLAQAQREHRWTSLYADALPRDLLRQHAVVVGWGPIARHLARMLQALGLRVTVVRQQDKAAEGFATLPSSRLREALPSADWLLLACPLTSGTRGLLDAPSIAALPAHAHVVNVARGEIVDEEALIAALQQGRLAGAYLDVFAQEPLPAHSPLWDLPNVIVTPHGAGLSDGNAARVAELFLGNLRLWLAGEPLRNVAPN